MDRKSLGVGCAGVDKEWYISNVMYVASQSVSVAAINLGPLTGTNYRLLSYTV